MELPAHVVERLRDEFHCRMIAKVPSGGEAGAVDALYVTADQPHQLSLYAEPEADYGLMVQKKTDAVYVTRFQKERWSDKERPYPKIDFLGSPQYADASVMHPLPRVNELDASFDSDRRAIYFRQAAYGVPVRMALISLLLHLHRNNSLHNFPGGFSKPEHPVYVQPIGTGIHCRNPNCITNEPAERQYAAHKFYVVAQPPTKSVKLRCLYCETDVEAEAATHYVVADAARRTFSPGLEALVRTPADKLRNLVIYDSVREARAADFAPRETAKKAHG
jgi:aspartate carbamoyltransferase catalytic subunit